MSNNVVQARYDQLDDIANRFARKAQEAAQMQQRILRDAQALQNGGWMGAGSQAFSNEMNTVVQPAMQRLILALETASSTTKEIKQILLAAEEEAARPFNGSGNDSQQNEPHPSNNSQTDNAADASNKTNQSGEITGELKWLHETNIGETKPTFGFKYGLLKGEIASESFDKSSNQIGPIPINGELKGSFGSYEANAGIEDGDIGLSGSVTVFQVTREDVIGNSDLGITKNDSIEALSLEGFIGVHDGNIGAKIGGKLVSVTREVGVNIAGANVGLKGEVGIKAEFGFSFGKQGVEVKLPFASIGLSFGKAKTGGAE